MLIRRPYLFAALATVAFVGLRGLWTGNLLPLKAGLATPGTPKAKLRIASSQPRILYQSHARNSADTEVEYQRFVKTQMELMRSRFVMNAALQHDGISRLPLLKSQADPIDWLVKNVEVNRLGDSELVEVSLPPTGLPGKEQATVINAVVSAYIDEVVNKDRRRMLQRHDTLKKLSKTYSEMLKTRRDTIRKLGACPRICRCIRMARWLSLGLYLSASAQRPRRTLPPQLTPARLARRQIFRRLCVKQISCHSADTFSSPRNRNLRIPRADLIWPNTGSTMCLRAA